MKTNQNLFTLLFLFSTAFLFAQTSEITVDLSKLDFGEVPRNSIYILSAGSFQIPQEAIFKYKVDHFPTMVKLTILKKNTFRHQKMIWINDTNIKLEGSLEDRETINVVQESDEQVVANQLFNTVSKGKELDLKNKLAFTMPYLSYLADSKFFINIEYLKNILEKLPVELSDFWATKDLQDYLSDIENVGYDSKIKHFTSVTAINKDSTKQTYKLTGEKYVLLDFSSSGCKPCIAHIDKLLKVDSVYSDKLDIVTLWNDREFRHWKNIAKKQKDKITWISLFDKNGAIHYAFKIKALPTYILIDKEGNVIKKWIGYPKDLNNFII